MKETTNYSMFKHYAENREVELNHANTKQLMKSMEKVGWHDGYPLIARQNGVGLMVVDGQHRLAVAEKLGIPVKYIIDDKNADMALVNSSSKNWKSKDYLHHYVALGNRNYMILQQYMMEHGMIISASAEILGTGVGKISTGDFVVKNIKKANEFGKEYREIRELCAAFSTRNGCRALWSAFNLSYIDWRRLKRNIKTQSSQIPHLLTVEDYLDCIEEIYNYRARVRKSVKFDAINERRLRRSGGD